MHKFYCWLIELRHEWLPCGKSASKVSLENYIYIIWVCNLAWVGCIYLRRTCVASLLKHVIAFQLATVRARIQVGFVGFRFMFETKFHVGRCDESNLQAQW